MAINFNNLNEVDELSNTDLQSLARAVHGSLYKRINNLQIQLNRANAIIEKQRSLISDLDKIAQVQTIKVYTKQEIMQLLNSISDLLK